MTRALYVDITSALGTDVVTIASCGAVEESLVVPPAGLPTGFILAQPTKATVDARNIRRSISSPVKAPRVRYQSGSRAGQEEDDDGVC